MTDTKRTEVDELKDKLINLEGSTVSRDKLLEYRRQIESDIIASNGALQILDHLLAGLETEEP